MGRERFDPDLLDEHEPFELDDDNRPHLAKHSPYTADDLVDAWHDPAGVFLEAEAAGPADWFFVARLPGSQVVQIPLAPSRSGRQQTCRPIGIYLANALQRRCYEEQEER